MLKYYTPSPDWGEKNIRFVKGEDKITSTGISQDCFLFSSLLAKLRYYLSWEGPVSFTEAMKVLNLQRDCKCFQDQSEWTKINAFLQLARAGSSVFSTEENPLQADEQIRYSLGLQAEPVIHH